MNRKALITQIRAMCEKHTLTTKFQLSVYNNLEILSTKSLRTLKLILEYGLKAGDSIHSILSKVQKLNFLEIECGITKSLDKSRTSIPLGIDLYLSIKDTNIGIYSDALCTTNLVSVDIGECNNMSKRLIVLSSVYDIVDRRCKDVPTFKPYCSKKYAEVVDNYLNMCIGSDDQCLSMSNLRSNIKESKNIPYDYKVIKSFESSYRKVSSDAVTDVSVCEADNDMFVRINGYPFWKFDMLGYDSEMFANAIMFFLGFYSSKRPKT